MQCAIIDNDFEKMKKVREEISKIKTIKIVNQSKKFKNKKIVTDSIYCDMVDLTVSKAVAASKICEILEVDIKDTIGIGDSYNDFELLNFVGYSVAMNNSVRGLKTRVDYVTDNNDLDGAAKFFEKILNNEIK